MQTILRKVYYIYMKEIHADLQTLKPYLYIIAGILLGIAFCMLLAKLGYLSLSGNKANNNSQVTQKLPGQQTEVVDYLKGVDPTKPYTDPNGVTHPALYSGEGTYVPPQPLTPEQLKEAIKNAPPVGGPAPIVPKAPAAPTPPKTVVPAVPVVPVSPKSPAATPGTAATTTVR